MSNVFKFISVDNEAAFNQISNAQIGEVVFVKDTGNMYVYTKCEYIKFDSDDIQDATLKVYSPSLFIHSYNRYNYGRNIQQAK